MSTFFCIALPDLGIAAADTRLNFEGNDGSRGENDSGQVDIEFPNCIRYCPPPDFRKIRPMPGGWVLGAGGAVLLEQSLERVVGQAVIQPSDPFSDLAAAIPDLTAKVGEVLPGLKNSRIHLAALLDLGAAFALHQLSAEAGITTFPEKADYVINTPPEFPAQEAAQLHRVVQGLFPLRRGERGVIDLLRLVGNLFSVVHATCQSVGPLAQIGVLMRRPSRLVNSYLRVRCADLAADPGKAWNLRKDPSSV